MECLCPESFTNLSRTLVLGNRRSGTHTSRNVEGTQLKQEATDAHPENNDESYHREDNNEDGVTNRRGLSEFAAREPIPIEKGVVFSRELGNYNMTTEISNDEKFDREVRSRTA